MMNKKILIMSLALVLFLSSCTFGTADNRLGINVYIEAENVQSIEIDFIRGDKVISTTGCGNADNTPMKKGQMFGFDKPEFGNSDFSLQINVKTADGKEFENEKTFITLPGGFQKYDLALALDEAGEYYIRLMSSERIDKNG